MLPGFNLALGYTLGPSGCGKTTLLRIIAALEHPAAGRIYFHGADASATDVRERRVGFVFQHYALFRHMTVYENVAFGLRVKPRGSRPTAAGIRDKVFALLKLVQLDFVADRFPSQLSGGQRQRIALARALAVEPKVLLLDEPFGALDAQVRKELRRLHDEIHVTSIFVTHDQEEALEVADRVVLMNKGRVEQEGTPDAVYEHPATPFVYGFLGTVNLFHGRAHDGRLLVGEAVLDAPEHGAARNAGAVAYARPHELEVGRYSPGAPGIFALLERALVVGPSARLELKRTDTGEHIEAEILADDYRRLGLRHGERLVVRPRKLRVFLDPPAEAKT